MQAEVDKKKKSKKYSLARSKNNYASVAIVTQKIRKPKHLIAHSPIFPNTKGKEKK